ncbi:MAG: hypothetical protein WAW13_00615 [Minisyncoccia bacterium]
MSQYQVIIPRTRVVLDAVESLSRAKQIAKFHFRRLSHPKYAPVVIVERVGPDGKRRKVWPTGSADLGIPAVTA